jgi:hypothetical protein
VDDAMNISVMIQGITVMLAASTCKLSVTDSRIGENLSSANRQ